MKSVSSFLEHLPGVALLTAPYTLGVSALAVLVFLVRKFGFKKQNESLYSGVYGWTLATNAVPIFSLVFYGVGMILLALIWGIGGFIAIILHYG